MSKNGVVKKIIIAVITSIAFFNFSACQQSSNLSSMPESDISKVLSNNENSYQEPSEDRTSEVMERQPSQNDELHITQLYLDFFKPYTDSIKKLTLDEFKQARQEDFKNYDVKIVEGNKDDLWEFYITDNNDNQVSLWFLPIDTSVPQSKWLWSLMLVTYSSGDKEISVTDNGHTTLAKYNTFDRNREPRNQTVMNASELEKFMFE